MKKKWNIRLRRADGSIKRGLVTGVVLAALIGLFYAEEDWRGWHAWDQFRRAGEARGEHYDWGRLTPPPVPDDQNFALTPMVESCYGQMLDRTGHEIRPRNTKLVNRLEMHYWSDVKNYTYTDRLNDWNMGKRTDLAALQRYYRAIAAKTNRFQVPAQPQSPAADVLLALSTFEATIEELRQAAQRPYARFPLEYDKEEPMEILLPHLPSLKSCGQVLNLRATAELQTGRSEQALADEKLLLRLADSLHNEPFLISQVFRRTMVQMMLQPVWEGLADHHWTDTQLAGLEVELAKLDFLTDYAKSMQDEMGFLTRFTQYVRLHPGDYYQLTHFNVGLSSSEISKPEFLVAVLTHWHLVPSGWFYQNQLRCGRCVAEFYLPAVEVKTHTFKPALVRQAEAFLKEERQHLTPFNIMECEFMPTPNKAAIDFAHAQCSVDLARVAMGLERYRLAQGRYPDSLAELAPLYLKQVPNDVIGGQPLHYRLTEDGRFTLYSVGWNEMDDGGTVELSPGKAHQDLSEGDWVWRYPQK